MGTTDSGFAIRPAGADDCAGVWRLVCALEGCALPYDRFAAIYARQLADPRCRCLVCASADGLAGVLNLRLEEQLHHATRVAEIMEFAVLPAYRGRGLGRQLLAAACGLAAQAGCAQIEAACNQRRADAHRFYLRAGMQNTHFKFTLPLPAQP